MKNNKWAATAMILFCAGKCHAQYNDSVNHYISVKSTATMNNTNNSSSYISDQEIKYGIRMKAVSLNESTVWMYGAQQKTLTNNDFSSSLDFDVHKLGPHMYYWGLGNFISSYSLKVNEQYQTGAGIAWKCVDRKKLTVNISDGILYEKNDLYLYDTVHDVYHTARNSVRLMLRWEVTNIVNIKYTGFYQQSFLLSTDYILKTNVAINIKLKNWLEFTSAFTYNSFKRTGQENTLFSYGLNFEHYY